MSTRARIALAMPNGKFKSIYVHLDGYPQGVGKVLAQHYGNANRIRDLLELGDLSQLGPMLVAPESTRHSHAAPSPNVTVAYGRDRGDTGTDASTCHNFTALCAIAAECNAEYVYVFGDKQWLYVPVQWSKGDPMPIEAHLQPLIVGAMQ